MNIQTFHNVAEYMVLTPLGAALWAGFGRHYLSKRWIDTVVTGAVGAAFAMALWLWMQVTGPDFHHQWVWYQWADLGAGLFNFHVGFWCDPLTLLMAMVVTGVSLMVHIYTIGYMADDPGYGRFFSYIALFTFAMLVLVVSDNFLQLFFGWEAVGLVSYLLIGFWHERPSAVHANLKAFLVNRVGDFGFILGIAAVFGLCHSLDYQAFFDTLHAHGTHGTTGQTPALWLNGIALLLFIGAMGKSAQVPLHVWLPDSMEGPTPISALIHAATMVTAGVFMVARMAPLYDQVAYAQMVILGIGTVTACTMGAVALVQYDIKRIVAYSTLSQLGYMVVALGVSAYSAAIFHLVTHAFFKALLFLAAGSVIMGMHHEQDIRKMGGLAKRMPVTCAASWIGTLALVGFPFFSGYYSKELILEAVRHSGHPWVYRALLGGVLLTALYSFRALFWVFHTPSRMDPHTVDHVHESPAVVTIPLVVLAVLSIGSGFWGIAPWGLGEVLGLADAPSLAPVKTHFTGAWAWGWHGIWSWPFVWVMAGAIAMAALCYPPARDQLAQYWAWLPASVVQWGRGIQQILVHQYYINTAYEQGLVPVIHAIGKRFWRTGDVNWIDGYGVHGSVRCVAWCAARLKKLHTGFVYHAALYMVLGILIGIAAFLVKNKA